MKDSSDDAGDTCMPRISSGASGYFKISVYMRA